MLSRKNAFEYFAISVFLIALVYALGSGIIALGEGKEYPYLQGGSFLILLLCIWLLINGAAALAARLDPQCRLRGARWMRFAEAAAVFVLLIAATRLRLWAVQTLPMQAESDYKTYYEIAEMIKSGTLKAEGPGFCDYIALFPHVYGYPCVLSLAFRLFGTSVRTAQYLNIALSVLTVFVTYRAARLAGGRLCGMAALLLTAFWPSQILYINMVASEYLFSFMLMVSLYVFVLTVKDFSGDAKHPLIGMLLHVFLGAWLALMSAVRPMALLLVITIAICTLFERLRIPVRPTRDQPISLILLSRGWVRCFTVIALYLCMNVLISAGIANATDRDIAGGSSSFGYNLLVGLNIESEGGWNQTDYDYLNAAMQQLGDASQAHLLCRDLALQRLENTKGVANLFFRKFQVLWQDDNYATEWNLHFMGQQGTLTEERAGFLYAAQRWGNIFYLTVIALAIVAGVTFWQSGAFMAYPFLLMFLGTAVMHLVMENQNRYHFHALYMLAVLAAFGVRNLCEAGRVRVQRRQEERRRLAAQKQEDALRRRLLTQEEENLTRLRREAMNSRFDMREALEKGFITVRVSKPYAEKYGVKGTPAKDERRESDAADE